MNDAPPGDYSDFLSLEEIAREAEDLVADLIGDEIEPLLVEVYGSRATGLSRPGSDLDVKLYYAGPLREDDVFNILNHRRLVIETLEVDINPIRLRKEKT